MLPTSEESRLPQILCASGVLSLKLFWKLSSISKELLALRDSPELCTGLGGVAAGLSVISERCALLDLLHDCIDRDDVRALQQLLPLRGLKGTFPGLFGRAVEKEAESCFALLRENPILFCPPDVSANFRSMKPEMLRRLLQEKVLDANMWMKVENTDQGNRTPWAIVWKPILNQMIDERNFDCAEVLLEFGARVDVCEWEAVKEVAEFIDSDDQDPYEFCDWRTGFGFSGKSPLHSLILALVISQPTDSKDPPGLPSQKSLAFLKRLVGTAKEHGCLDWTAIVPHHALALPFRREFDCYIQYELSALSLACTFLQPAVVDVLLEGGARVQAESKGYSPLLACIQGSFWPLATFLLESCGADPNRKGRFIVESALPWGATGKVLMSPLCACLYRWNKPRGGGVRSIAQRDAEGAAALSLVRLLVEKGARCDLPDSSTAPPAGQVNTAPCPPSTLSPLLLACSLDPPSPPTIRLLVSQAGADSNLPGRTKETDDSSSHDEGLSRPLEVVLRQVARSQGQTQPRPKCPPPPQSFPSRGMSHAIGRGCHRGSAGGSLLRHSVSVSSGGGGVSLSASHVQGVLAVSTLLELGARTDLLSEELRTIANMWVSSGGPSPSPGAAASS
uniref:Uncharacterized protein n=1 Tax=Chromera velia CCMP2878 TaxID=1169474 RepID=A0A0G4HHY6_9ALVE|eukprot:Cvel_27660.t1-p1 / transcript=Cvel_27660.t1 / gene=Cvel_27660 / organism=Chromera_velia_CCMP2878 / gene_product=hypothetical protein / transcript_product=hypothetical protein / location=Cvel_scaffold3485:10937-13336(+) / protein_length=620 / sequence_SO=supercontig / SO=protein_coding / is_pseudo=false